jgi:hypothetical protein
MEPESPDREDLDWNSFYYFVQALKILSHAAEQQCNEMGNYNTPWELRHEVTRTEYFFSSPYPALPKDVCAEIRHLYSLLYALPEAAMAPMGANMLTHAGCVAAMSHPSWQQPREIAKDVLENLPPLIEQVEIYLKIR